MKIMPPRRDPSLNPSNSSQSSPFQDLALALNQLMLQRGALTQLRLDTCFQLPKFSGQMNGEAADSWMSPDLTEDKLHIASLQLEGVAQAWWDTQLESASPVIGLSFEPGVDASPITYWEAFCTL